MATGSNGHRRGFYRFLFQLLKTSISETCWKVLVERPGNTISDCDNMRRPMKLETHSLNAPGLRSSGGLLRHILCNFVRRVGFASTFCSIIGVVQFHPGVIKCSTRFGVLWLQFRFGAQMLNDNNHSCYEFGPKHWPMPH